MGGLGRFVLLIGVALVVIGGLLIAFPRIGTILGRLPGDFRFETDQLTCLIPLGTSILLSIFLTVILNLFARLNR
ncbi:MAG: DUF2905 domain-containing protein [Anaerolineales bacterium]